MNNPKSAQKKMRFHNT